MQKLKFVPWIACFLLLVSLTACVSEKAVQKVAEKAVGKAEADGALKEEKLISIEKDKPSKLDAKKDKKNWDKRTFFQFMKPIVERENKLVMQDRQHLLAWQKNKDFEAGDLKPIAQRYRVQWNGKADGRFWRSILDRVDEIPLELALLQAANESSWGNSRFARQANNYFGQWCFRQGCGLVPLRRNAGATHEVQYFSSADLSVRAYLFNLNTSPSYKLFRNLRRALRRQDKPLDAEFLAIGLKGYSERGMHYVRIIQSMVRSNKQLIQTL